MISTLEKELNVSRADALREGLRIRGRSKHRSHGPTRQEIKDRIRERMQESDGNR